MCDKCDKPALKIEAGKYYRRRNGEKIFCLSVTVPGPFHGMPEFPILMQTEKIRAVMYRLDGSWVGLGTKHELDIIEEWRELAARDAIVYLYKDDDCDYRVTLSPGCYGHTVLGSTRVNLAEGQFDK